MSKSTFGNAQVNDSGQNHDVYDFSGSDTEQDSFEVEIRKAVLEKTYNLLSVNGYSCSLKCGYCLGSNSSFNFYLSTTSISPAFYQFLADKSWRRSGSLLYRPNPRASCCPHYTIRLDAHAYKPTRKQRQAVNALNKYIIGDEYKKDAARLYPLTRAQAKYRDNHFDFPERLHETEFCNLKKDLKPAHKFEVTLEPDSYTTEKFCLYREYQQRVHASEDDNITANGFKRFLCDSPIRRGKFEGLDGTERDIGSFHQCYRIDGKLVAVGVLDLMPHCISSVYFFYADELAQFSPGKISAMYEISMARRLGYDWWYSGFYIRTCPKMQYKIDFQPQYVLDVTKDEYIKMDDAVMKIMLAPWRPIVETHKEIVAGNESVLKLRPDDENITKHTEKIWPGWPAGSSKPMESVFRADMPGVLTAEEVDKMKNLGKIPVLFHKSGHLVKVEELSEFETGSVTGDGAKGMVAQLVAGLGSMEGVIKHKVWIYQH